MHLRALTLGTADPTAAAHLYAALGARIGGTPRGGDDTLALVGRTMITHRRTPAPIHTVLGIMVPDVNVVGDRLDAAGIEWSCETPGVIGFRDIDGNPCYAVESPPRDLSLIGATLFVGDVAATTAWWTAAGMPTGRSETLGYRVPAAARQAGAAVFLDGDLTLHLVPAAGDGLVTTAMRLRIHVDDSGDGHRPNG